MALRIAILLVCLLTIICCTLVVHDLPGWSSLGLDMKIVVVALGSMTTSVLGFLVLFSETDIKHMRHAQQVKARQQHIIKRLP